jgi:hypothetical protein
MDLRKSDGVFTAPPPPPPLPGLSAPPVLMSPVGEYDESARVRSVGFGAGPWFRPRLVLKTWACRLNEKLGHSPAFRTTPTTFSCPISIFFLKLRNNLPT